MNKTEKKFRYETTGLWFKGNTHIHSNASDGGMGIPEIARLYAEASYDFIFITDHWVSSDVSVDCQDPPLLLIDGIELDGTDQRGSYFHVVCLGRTENIRREDGFAESVRKAREQDALLVLAHPHWCGNTLEDAVSGSYDGVEVYNHVCHWLNGKSNGHIHWDAMLRIKGDTLCFSSDDAHLKPEHPGWNGGWIVVNAAANTKDAVLASIKQGNFYSSCGPEIYSIDFDGTSLDLKCSPVKNIRLVGPSFRGWRSSAEKNGFLDGARIEVPSDWEYMYLEIENEIGQKAWSNALFI